MNAPETRVAGRREALFDVIAEQSGLGVVLLDPRTERIVEWNDRAASMLGYSSAEYAALALADLEAEMSRGSLAAAVRALAPGAEAELESRHRHKDGSLRDIWIRLKHVALPDADYVAGVWADVSRRKQTEAQLEKLSRAIEQSPESIVITDVGGCIEFVNHAFVRTSGYTREEVLGRNPRLLKSGQTPRATYHEMWARLRRGETWRGELVNRHKDGSLYVEEAIISPIRRDDGAVTHYVAVKQDISERRRMAEELARHREKLEDLVQRRTDEIAAIFRALPDVYFRLDRRGVILDYLASTAAKLYAPPEAFLHRRVQDVLPETAAAAITVALDRVAGGETMVDVVYELAIQEGPRIFEARMTPVGHDEVVAVVRDITERQRADQALADARDAALAANRAKSAFLANMSHEIRTPMNAILGLTHLVRSETVSARSREHLDKVSGAAHHLLAIINDVLDLSKIEAGKLAIESAEFAVEAVAVRACDLVCESARAKGLEVVLDVGALPEKLRGDGLRLGQVLVNFCSNAVKFTERGHVTLRGSVVSTSGAATRVRFEVEDTGIGFDDEQRRRLFQSFEQADVSTTRKYGGTGLGLVIAKRVAQLMGGEVGCEGAPRRGARFWIEAPFGTVAAPPPQGTAPLAGRRVLVVDDHEGARGVCRGLLRALGAHVTVVASGAEAIVTAAGAERDGDPFDIALVDRDMPGLDGLETGRRLAMARKPAALLLLSAAPDVPLETLSEAGFSGHLTKPVALARLRAALGHVVGHEAADAGPPSSTREHPARACAERARRRPLRLLLAEDDELSREVGRELLAAVGLAADTANDGREAVSRARVQSYDLILMDVQMPGMNGHDATRSIRALPGYARTPILAMTADAFAEDREACLAVGMNDHISKPVDPTTLYRTLLRWWPDDGRAPSQPPRRKSSRSQVNAVAALRQELAQVEGFSLQRGMDAVGGDVGLLVRLLCRLRDTRREDGEKIVALLEEGDRGEAQRMAHSLRGVAGTLGLVEVQGLSGALERALKEGSPAPEARAHAGALDQALRRAAAVLDRVLPPGDAPGEPVDPAEWRRLAHGIARLQALLVASDPAAVEQIRELGAPLQRAIRGRATEVARKIADLDFPAALEELRAAIVAEPRLRTPS